MKKLQTPPKKSCHLFPSNPPLKLRSYQAPLFEILVGGSTPPPPAEREGGCTLWQRQLTLQYHLFSKTDFFLKNIF